MQQEPPTIDSSVTPPAAPAAQHVQPTTDAVAAYETMKAASQPASQPTTQPVPYYETRGDVLIQMKQAIDNVGLTQTVSKTPLTGWILFLLGLCAGLILGRVIGALLRRAGDRAAQHVRLARAVLINSFIGPISLLLFMIGFFSGLSFLTLSDPLRHFLGGLFQLLNLIWIGWLLYNLIDLVTIVLGRWSRGRQGNLSIMLVPLTRKTLRGMLVVVLLLFAAENIFNQDVKTLLAGLGIAGLAVSLAAQDSLRNLFGSIMIFADQPFSIGDLVKINDMEGNVEDIGFRSTRLRTAEGYVATIPNGNIAGAAVLNYSRRRGIRRSFDITLPADVAPDKMLETIKLLRETLAEPRFANQFDSNHPATVTFDDPTQRRARVTYWFKSKDTSAYAQHAETLNLELVERFHQAGIVFK